MPRAKKEKSVTPRKKKIVVELDNATPTNEGAYILVIETGGEVFTYNTDDLTSTLQAFKPKILKTQTVIRATYAGKTVEKVLFVAKARQLFSNPLTALVLAKNLNAALNVPQ